MPKHFRKIGNRLAVKGLVKLAIHDRLAISQMSSARYAATKP